MSKSNNNITRVFKESYKESKAEMKSIGYKFVSYPIIAIVSVVIIALTLFNVMPYVTFICLQAYGSDLGLFYQYYPSFILIDAGIGIAACKLVKFLALKINDFCKKHISKGDKK